MQPDAAVVVPLQNERRLLRIVEIAEHDRRAGQADLALLAGGDLLRCAGADDLIEGVGEGNADGAVARGVDRRQAAGRYAFRRAVALADLHLGIVRAQEGVDLVLQLHGQGVAAGEYAHEERHVELFQPGRAQQSLEQRRHAGDEVRVLFAQQVGIGPDVEIRHEDAAGSADERRVDADAEAEAVEHGHDGEHRAAADAFIAAGCDGLQRKSVEIVAGKADALRRAGRAAGIEDAGAGIALAVVRRKRTCGFAQQVRPERIALLWKLRRFAALRQVVAEAHERLQLRLQAGDPELRLALGPCGGRGYLAVEAVER